MKTMNASYFKARCLAILDRVRETGERVVILKRGRPVAELGPATRWESDDPQADLRGTGTVTGDIVEPAVPEHHWEALASGGAGEGQRDDGPGGGDPGRPRS